MCTGADSLKRLPVRLKRLCTARRAIPPLYPTCNLLTCTNTVALFQHDRAAVILGSERVRRSVQLFTVYPAAIWTEQHPLSPERSMHSWTGSSGRLRDWRKVEKAKVGGTRKQAWADSGNTCTRPLRSCRICPFLFAPFAVCFFDFQEFCQEQHMTAVRQWRCRPVPFGWALVGEICGLCTVVVVVYW